MHRLSKISLPLQSTYTTKQFLDRTFIAKLGRLNKRLAMDKVAGHVKGLAGGTIIKTVYALNLFATA
jgi:hypothetical protein